MSSAGQSRIDIKLCVRKSEGGGGGLDYGCGVSVECNVSTFEFRDQGRKTDRMKQNVRIFSNLEVSFSLDTTSVGESMPQNVSEFGRYRCSLRERSISY